MANYASAVRRIRKSAVSHERNKHYRSMVKTAVKKVRESTDKEQAQALYRSTSSLLDRLVNKGVIHRNKAANQKSKLANHVNSL